jgi:hypothetical protein
MGVNKLLSIHVRGLGNKLTDSYIMHNGELSEIRALTSPLLSAVLGMKGMHLCSNYTLVVGLSYVEFN